MSARIALRSAVCLLVMFLFSTAAFGSFPIRSRDIGGTTHVVLNDVVRYYGLKSHVSGRRITLYGAETEIILTIDSRAAKINGFLFNLAYAPTLKDNEAMISERDLSLSIDPILRPQALASGNADIRRIIIDPGHGGKDSGARGGQKANEKTINMMIAQDLQWMLESLGYEAYLTRDRDTYISLAERQRRCQQWGGDLFISIHCNAARNKSANGIETFVVPPAGTPKTGDYKPSTRTPGNEYDKFNMRLAYEVHRYVIAATGAQDRGVKRDRFYILKKASCPSILVESGFLSNADEQSQLADRRYRHDIAEAIASGIVMYHRAVAGQ